jgi:hypothetical protein
MIVLPYLLPFVVLGMLQDRPLRMSNIKIQISNGGCAARGHLWGAGLFVLGEMIHLLDDTGYMPPLCEPSRPPCRAGGLMVQWCHFNAIG